MQTGRRTQLLTFLLLIAINLLVVPNWFSPGRFTLGSRLILAALNIGIIAFCAWRISRILGVNPFSRSKRPTYAPYASLREDEAAWSAEREPFSRTGRAAGGSQRARSQPDQFSHDDPYDGSPDTDAGAPGRD